MNEKISSEKNVKYECDGAVKHSEVDDFDKGCSPDTGQLSNYGIKFSSTSLRGLVQSICDHHDVERSACLFDSCEEIGRLDVQVLENYEGLAASPGEIANWRQGNCRLWACTYTYWVERVYRCRVQMEGNKEIDK